MPPTLAHRQTHPLWIRGVARATCCPEHWMQPVGVTAAPKACAR